MDPSTMQLCNQCNQSSRSQNNRAAHLVDLPEEILEEITSHLNSDSLIALASSSCRLRRIMRNSPESMKLRKIAGYVLFHLKFHGSSVRRLDLSGCKASWAEIKSAIRHCQHITELNVINSDFRCLGALSGLENLETLCMSALSFKQKLPKFRESVRSIKKLHLDVGPQVEELRFTLALMNLCELIEYVHVNFYGHHDFSRTRNYLRNELPVLAAERWDTLKTFICTRHLSGGMCNFDFLLSVFFHNDERGIADWISEIRDCYIYEHGQVNGKRSRHVVLDENVRLLREYHDAELTDANRNDIFRSAWGSPRSVRLKSRNVFTSPLTCAPSIALTELDLRRCHRQFTQNFRLRLIAAAPSLEMLACSFCFFIVTEDDISSQQKALGDALRKLKLKIFCLKRVSLFKNFARFCDMDSEGPFVCSNCRLATPLTSSNVVDFTAFPHLEHLTLSGVTMRDSAYEKIANPKLRCVRICLDTHNEYWGLHGFIQRCQKLTYLKIEGFDLPVRSENFWKALDTGKNLTQLCLRSGVFGLKTSKLSDELLDCFERLVQRLEVMHLHCPDYEFRDALRMSREESFKRLQTTPDYDFHIFSSRDVRNSTADSNLPARALCLSDFSAGLVPPLGWDLE